MIRITCPVYSGTGTLTISKDLEDHVGLLKRILREIMRSGRIIREIIQNIENSFGYSH